MINKVSINRINLYLFMLSLLLLSVSAYMQVVKQMQPCPLCVMQRLSVILLAGITFWGMWVHSKRLLIINSSLQVLVAACGLFFAARQVWLQHLPIDKIPACGPGLNYLIQYVPWDQIFKALFYGTGDCAKVVWRFVGLTMPEWMIIWFSVFGLTALYNMKQSRWRF